MSPHNSLDKVFWYLGQTIGTLFIVIALYGMYLRISELADTPNWSPMMALKRYRKYLGLTGLPSPAESDPLILKQKGRGGVFSTRQLRDIVQRYFNSTVRRLREEGFTDDTGALQCIGCDTQISDDVKIRPREHVRDDSGHRSSVTTDRYIDIEKRERHSSAKKKK